MVCFHYYLVKFEGGGMVSVLMQFSAPRVSILVCFGWVCQGQKFLLDSRDNETVQSLRYSFLLGLPEVHTMLVSGSYFWIGQMIYSREHVSLWLTECHQEFQSVFLESDDRRPGNVGEEGDSVTTVAYTRIISPWAQTVPRTENPDCTPCFMQSCELSGGCMWVSMQVIYTGTSHAILNSSLE